MRRKELVDALARIIERNTANGKLHEHAIVGVNFDVVKAAHKALTAKNAKSRSARSGRFVTKGEAAANPDTTVKES